MVAFTHVEELDLSCGYLPSWEKERKGERKVLLDLKLRKILLQNCVPHTELSLQRKRPLAQALIIWFSENEVTRHDWDFLPHKNLLSLSPLGWPDTQATS